MMNGRISAILLGGALLALSGCSNASAYQSDVTALPLPDALDQASGLQTVAEGLKQTRLKSLFTKTGSFTLFAPDDAAFGREGDTARALTHSSDFAPLSTLLRQHIVPGYFTPQALFAAIDAAADHVVRLHSLGGTVLTLSKGRGDALIVTSSNGYQATFDGTAIISRSNAAIGLNGFLGKV